MAASGPNPTRSATGPRSHIGTRLGVWLFATVFAVIAPLFPIFVEVVKSGDVRPESYLLTAAVLSIGYGLSSQAPLSWATYSLIFLMSVGYDFNPTAIPPSMAWPPMIAEAGDWMTHHLALSLMLLVAMLHTAQRFVWHVILDRPFPDWRHGG